MNNDWHGILDRLVDRMHDAPTVSACVHSANTMLPNSDRLLERNAAISGAYAAMRLRHPRLFKWSGMAAFASQHVRKLITVLNASRSGTTHAKAMSRIINGAELEVIRSINNAIFSDIYWAHAVYDGRPEGMDHLHSLLDGTSQQEMVKGFELIEQGRLILDTDPTQAEQLIWEGNIQLLWHEQQRVVQPMLSQLSGMFARVFSLGSSLNYEPSGMIDCMKYCSSFYLFMLVKKPGVLIRSHSAPRLNKLDQRWAWILQVLVPNYRSLEQESAAEKLEVIAKNGLEAIGLD